MYYNKNHDKDRNNKEKNNPPRSKGIKKKYTHHHNYKLKPAMGGWGNRAKGYPTCLTKFCYRIGGKSNNGEF